LPALLAVLEQLPQQPDLVFVDGHGVAHPRRLGVAAHFGVATGLPSIGVARKIWSVTASFPTRPVVHTPRCADGREQIGWLLRSKVKCNPLVVSPGHRVAMASAADW
jgi:deoxyribonuclease V